MSEMASRISDRFSGTCNQTGRGVLMQKQSAGSSGSWKPYLHFNGWMVLKKEHWGYTVRRTDGQTNRPTVHFYLHMCKDVETHKIGKKSKTKKSRFETFQGNRFFLINRFRFTRRAIKWGRGNVKKKLKLILKISKTYEVPKIKDVPLKNTLSYIQRSMDNSIGTAIRTNHLYLLITNIDKNLH